MQKMHVISGVITSIFLAIVMFANTGCGPGQLAVGAVSFAGNALINEAVDVDSGKGGKYDLSSYNSDINSMGGDSYKIDSAHYYVVYNSRGDEGGEGKWHYFIQRNMGFSGSEYKVLKKDVRETYPGFVAQQVEGIIRISGDTQKDHNQAKGNEDLGGRIELVAQLPDYREYNVIYNSDGPKENAKEQWTQYVKKQIQGDEYEVIEKLVLQMDGEPTEHQVKGAIRVPQ